MERGIASLPPVYIDLLPDNRDALYGKGPIPCDYMFIGIAPSMSRPSYRKNEPFGARSHSTVEKIIEASGERVYLTNLLREPFPSNKRVPIKEVRKAYPLLAEEIAIVRPKRILALGEVSAKVMCPSFSSMREDHGTIFRNPELEAYVVPTYHFSAVGRNPSLAKLQIRDIQRFFELPNPIKPTTISVTKNEIDTLWDIFFKAKRVYLDIETDGLELGTKIRMVGLGLDDVDHVYIIHNPRRSTLRDMIALFRETKPIIVGHNLVFDLAQINNKANAAWLPEIEDTMVMAYCLGYGKGDWEKGKSRKAEAGKSLALKHLTTIHTDRPGSRAFGDTEDEGYLAEDVLSTRDLRHILARRVRQEKIPIIKTLHYLIPRTALMRKRGVYVDALQTLNVRDRTHQKIEAAQESLREFGGDDTNWNSPQQVSKKLKAAGVPLRVKTKTGWSVKESVLLALAKRYPVCQNILDLRAAEKEEDFLNSYWDTLTPEHSYLHPRLILTTTSTGRPSCRDPNLQQVTRLGPLKTLFTSRWEDKGGMIGLMDLSQVELRVAAWLHGDSKLAEALNTDDAHRTIASQVYQKPRDEITATERKKSKAVTFGACLYLGTPGGISERTGFKKAEITRIQSRFWKEYHKLRRGFNHSISHDLRARRTQGFLGRIRDLDDLIRIEGSRGTSRKIVNTPIQQLASDILLILLEYIFWILEDKRMRTIPIITIHDAIMFDIHPQEIELLALVIEEAFEVLSEHPRLKKLHFWNSLPVVGEIAIGKSWANCESTNENYNPVIKWEFST